MNYSFSTYGYNLSNADTRQMMNFVTGMGAGMIVLLLALLVFEIVCIWKVFQKAGEPGWKCLIPIYNAYIYMKISWEGKYFWWILLLGILPGILTGVALGSSSGGLAGISGFVSIAAYVAIAVISIIALVKLAKRFGKSGGFAVGLIFLEPIFIAILAFDSSTYNRELA